ncbi:MAG: DUF4169 family protein [Pseudomonadota bacterium]
MAEIINLNRARKAKKRFMKEATAAQNRARFGRTKAEKHKDAAEEAQRNTLLDGAFRNEDGLNEEERNEDGRDD